MHANAWGEIAKRMPHFKSTYNTLSSSNNSAIETKCYSQMMCTFRSHTHACSMIICVMFCLRRVEPKCFFFCMDAVHIACMILCMATFLCILYAEICVNTTTEYYIFHLFGLGYVANENVGRKEMAEQSRFVYLAAVSGPHSVWANCLGHYSVLSL